jgi:hypothetical protein
MNARCLYNEALQLWLTLFNLEPQARTCEEAWRLRFLCERAHRRYMRRADQLKREKAKKGKSRKAKRRKR